MTKKDILNKIKQSIISEDSNTPGITVTKKVQKTDKEFNDAYYKDVDKKMKDYTNLKKNEKNPPKYNDTDEEVETYGGSGMEGLIYDDEETENYKKFEKRNDEINKPSKDYILKKDEVNDVYSKLKKAGDKHKAEKKKLNNTPPVRTIKAESTIKRLKYKTPFINENQTIGLIPVEFKSNNMVFEMTDGNQIYKIRWEGDAIKGNPIILLYKNQSQIDEQISKMDRLINYNSREKLEPKIDVLTEEEVMKNFFIEKKKAVTEQVTSAGSTPVTTLPAANAKNLVTNKSKSLQTIIDTKNNTYTIGKMGNENVVWVQPKTLTGKQFELFRYQPGTGNFRFAKAALTLNGIYSNLDYLKFALGLTFQSENTSTVKNRLNVVIQNLRNDKTLLTALNDIKLRQLGFLQQIPTDFLIPVTKQFYQQNKG